MNPADAGASPAPPRRNDRQPRPPKVELHGWLVLDKPSGITSTHALSKVKRVFRAKKAGHAGTLDPLATGILPIAFGEATKTVPFAMDGEKTYRFTVAWGAATDTDDAEGEVIQRSDRRPTAAEVAAVLPRFTGTILQTPPRYSAIKIAGERAYDLARDGEEFELEAREIEIRRLELVATPDADTAVFEADCGKGAYVRALARDLAAALGTCGHIAALRRTRVGAFTEAQAISLDEIESFGHGAAGEAGPSAPLAKAILPVETALDDIPALAVNRVDAARLRQGQAVILRGRDAPTFEGPVYVTASGALVALAEIEGGELVPRRVFHIPPAAGAARPD